MNFHGHPV